VASPSGKAEACKASIPSSNLGAIFLFHIMLYLIATPIGNLADISLRALDQLRSCEYILCEDTRHSLILLQHYQICKPLKSYHKFNETAQLEKIVGDLQAGKEICLMSDAGTPGISDPGTILVQNCIEQEIPFTLIPGPCAAIHAICCSGLSTKRFQFWGFLPRKSGELKQDLQLILSYSGTTICYESPHRLINVLELIHLIEPTRIVVVGRELTKKFEEFVRGPAAILLEYWKNHPLKGEIVLLISPPSPNTPDWSHLSPTEHVQWIEDTYKISQKEAIKLAAHQRDVSKREIYSEIHKN
jgi:16S rRNA (cytidine1402-2'-O)-methyltransferase